MFFDSHGFKQNIVLRTEAKAFTNPCHVLPYIKSINVSGSSTWWQEACNHKTISDIENNRQKLTSRINSYLEFCSKGNSTENWLRQTKPRISRSALLQYNTMKRSELACDR